MANTPLGFPFGFFTNDNTPVDGKYFNRVTKLPYVDISEAISLLPLAVRYKGLTINIAGVEYWWPADSVDLSINPIIKEVDLSTLTPKLLITPQTEGSGAGVAAIIRNPNGGSFFGGYAYASGTKVTGIIRITLPVVYYNRMMTIEGAIKRGNADEVIKFTVGGYFSGNSTNNWWSIDVSQWERQLTDNLDLPVKLGYKIIESVVYPVIDFGSISTVWSSYTYIQIDKIYVLNGSVDESFLNGYSVSVIDVDDIVSNRNNTFQLKSGGASDFADLGGNARDNASLLGEIEALEDSILLVDAKADIAQEDIDNHEARTDNPHAVTKTQVGLANVNNTSDANKPVSTAQQAALDTKVDKNTAITGATKTKVTYDSKGLVTAGADATTADIADSTNKRYQTDNQNTFNDATSSIQTQLNSKQGSLGFTPENVANKENVTLDTSTSKYPTNNLVKTNVDLKANIASPTFTGTVTTPAIVVSSETSSRLAIIDSSKNIKSADTATYPSLTELTYVKGVTSVVQTQIDNKQASDATLTALAAYNTNGILTQTAADTFTGRTITGTTNQVTVTNGNGVAGNPTLSLPQDIHTAATPQFTRIGLSAAANVAAYITAAANTASVGQLYFPPSAVDYTGTLSGMLWNNASEWKFYDGVLGSVNRFIKLNGNSILANSNSLNVVTSTGTGGNLGTLKAEVAFGRYPTAVSYTVLLTDVGFGWIIAVTSTSSARTITLPLANTVPAGWRIMIKDESGGALTNNITIALSGSDTTDTTNIITNGGSRNLYSDGVSKWFNL